MVALLADLKDRLMVVSTVERKVVLLEILLVAWMAAMWVVVKELLMVY